MTFGYRSGTIGANGGCLICGRQLSFHQRVFNRICGDWRCKATLLDQGKADHRNQAAQAIGIEHPDSYPMVVVPDSPAEVIRQPQKRKRAHIDFLYDLCVKTIHDPESDSGAADKRDSVEPEPRDPMSSMVCEVCRGTCCHPGKEKSFLDKAAIRRFAAISGFHDPLEIVYAYYGRLPEMAVADACVYQTNSGCALPRWMRANICNAYHCNGLQLAERMIQEIGIDRLYVVVRKDNRITRSAFIRGRRMYHYPPLANALKD